ASDRSGKEIFHSFKIRIVGKGELPKGEDPSGRTEKPKADDPPARAESPPARPTVAVGAIKPPDLKGDRAERTLPAAIGEVCVGGGGAVADPRRPLHEQAGAP